jgi:hypothetical protein
VLTGRVPASIIHSLATHPHTHTERKHTHTMNKRIEDLVNQSGSGRRGGVQIFDDAALAKFVKLLLEEAVSEVHAVRTLEPNATGSRVLDLAVGRVRSINRTPPPAKKKPMSPKMQRLEARLTASAEAEAPRWRAMKTPQGGAGGFLPPVGWSSMGMFAGFSIM